MKLKAVVLTMVILTVALIGATLYCSWVIGRELNKYGYQEDTGLFVDPLPDYLFPFRIHLLFLEYAWIAFAIVSAMWIVLGITLVRKRRKSLKTGIER
jgi:hypothetical protein